MHRTELEAMIRGKLHMVYEVPDNGYLALEATLTQTQNMHGLTASPYREQETTKRFCDVICTVASIYVANGETLDSFLSKLHSAKPSREKMLAPNLTQEDWILLMRDAYEIAKQHRVSSLVGKMNPVPSLTPNSYMLTVAVYAALALGV